MAERRVSRWYFGGLASCGAACCTHPLDLLKVGTGRGVRGGLPGGLGNGRRGPRNGCPPGTAAAGTRNGRRGMRLRGPLGPGALQGGAGPGCGRARWGWAAPGPAGLRDRRLRRPPGAGRSRDPDPDLCWGCAGSGRAAPTQSPGAPAGLAPGRLEGLGPGPPGASPGAPPWPMPGAARAGTGCPGAFAAGRWARGRLWTRTPAAGPVPGVEETSEPGRQGSKGTAPCLRTLAPRRPHPARPEVARAPLGSSELAPCGADPGAPTGSHCPGLPAALTQL